MKMNNFEKNFGPCGTLAQLDADLRTSFFKLNPSADEAAFKRLLPSLRDDHMRKKTVEGFVDLKSKKKASGMYGNL